MEKHENGFLIEIKGDVADVWSLSVTVGGVLAHSGESLGVAYSSWENTPAPAASGSRRTICSVPRVQLHTII